jgi:hypothetical protein
MRETRPLKYISESSQSKKIPRFYGVTGITAAPSIPTACASIAGAYVPTDEEIIVVNSVLNKEGCSDLLALALEAVATHKAAGQATSNPSCK